MKPESLWARLLALSLFALSWQGLAVGWDSPLLPTLSETLRALYSAFYSEDQLLAYARDSFRVYGAGVGLGGIFAFTLAVAACFRGPGKWLLLLATVMEPLPWICAFPLLQLHTGSPNPQVIALILCTAIPMLSAAGKSLDEVPLSLLFFARNLGLNGVRLVRHILFPSLLPGLFRGARRGLLQSWALLVAMELFQGAPEGGTGGLGWFVQLQKQNNEIATAYAGCLFLFCVAWILDLFLATLEARASRFRAENTI